MMLSSIGLVLEIRQRVQLSSLAYLLGLRSEEPPGCASQPAGQAAETALELD